MDKTFYFINAIILFYTFQRLSEVLISRFNESWLKKNCAAIEIDPKETQRMKLFHTCWFIALIIEANIKKALFSPFTSFAILVILGLCLLVRFLTMKKLKKFWTIKILKNVGHVLVTDGLYRYLRHPNYLIVILEFLFLPLLFKAYFTMIIFSLLNIFVLYNRIILEEETLMKVSNYAEKFKNVKRLLPFFTICLFFFSSVVFAAEVDFDYKSYEEAKKAPQFIKFEGKSTKLGLITTGFDGYAKVVKIVYNLSVLELSQLDATILVKGLDTDLGARNDKMMNEVFEKDKYPEVKVNLVKKITLKPGTQTVDMNFTIKEKQIIKAVTINIEKRDNKLLVTGATTMGLKELGLPDPSIAIAKVRDSIDLHFAVIL